MNGFNKPHQGHNDPDRLEKLRAAYKGSHNGTLTGKFNADKSAIINSRKKARAKARFHPKSAKETET